MTDKPRPTASPGRRVTFTMAGVDRTVIVGRPLNDQKEAGPWIFEAHAIDAHGDRVDPAEFVVKEGQKRNDASINRITVERAVYESIETVRSAGGFRDIAVLRYYGSEKGSDPADPSMNELLLLERALFSLDELSTSTAAEVETLLERTGARDRDGELGTGAELLGSVCRDIGTLAAAAVGRTLLAFDRAPEKAFEYRAHRDIKIDNLFVVERDGSFEVVLGDFALAYLPKHLATPGDRLSRHVVAPEQYRNPPPEPGTQTDLWGLGMALWTLFHANLTPYRLNGAEWLSLNGLSREQLGESSPLATDLCKHDRRAGCVLSLDDEGRSPAHELAAALISSHRHNRSRTAVMADAMPELEESATQIIARVRESGVGADDPTADLLARSLRIIAPSLRERALSSKEQEAAEWRPEERHGGPAAAVVQKRSKGSKRAVRDPERLQKRRALRRRIVTGAAEALVSSGLHALTIIAVALPMVAIVLAAGWAAPQMPLPSAAVDVLLRSVFAGVFTVLSVLLALLCLRRRLRLGRSQRRYFRRSRRSSRDLRRRWVTMVTTGVLTVLVAAGFVVFVLGLPLGVFDWLLIASGGLLAAGINRASRLGDARGAPVSDGSSARPIGQSRGGLLVTGAAAMIGAVLVIGSAATPAYASALRNHVVTPTLVGSVPGMPLSIPVLINPHAIATNSVGDIALVDRVGVGRDVIWNVPADGTPAWKVLSTFGWRSPTPDMKVPAATELSDVQTMLSDITGPSTGDPVLSVENLAFIDDSSLALVGVDGVTRVDLDRDGGSKTTRLNDAVTLAMPDGIDAEISIVGSTIHLLEMKAPSLDRQVPYCFSTGLAERDENGEAIFESPSGPYVRLTGSPTHWTMTLAGDDLQPVLSTEDGDECLDAVYAFYESQGGGGTVVNHRRSDDNNSYAMFLKPFRSGDEQQADALTVGTYIRDMAVMEDGRVLVNTDNCLGAFTLSESAPPRPTMVEEGQLPAPLDPNADPPSQEMLDARKAANERCGTSASPLFSGLAEPREQESSDDCVLQARNTAQLVYSASQWKPMALSSDGTSAVVISSVDKGCTAIPWKLRTSGTVMSWDAVGDIATQSRYASNWTLGTTSVMSASDPSVGNSVAWSAPAYGRIHSSYRSSTADSFNGFPPFSDRPIIQRTIGGLTWTLGTTLPADASDDAITEETGEITQLIVTRPSADKSTSSTARYTIPGLQDITADGDHVVVARCGQVWDIDTNAVVAHDADGDYPLDDLAPTVIAGAAADPNASCGAPLGPALESQSTLIGSWVAPLAVSANSAPAGHCGDSECKFALIAIAEAAMFDGVATSRVRIIDRNKDAISTAGILDGAKQRKTTPESPLAGDLSQLGLVPTDVALDDAGRIAVSTATAKGTGPLIVIDGDRRSIVDAGTGVQVTGAAWSDTSADDDLVVTDGTRGDLLIFELSASATSH
ncbi:protein kinase family protein [Herbiconiux sp. VKM Ac-2851]|uniref:protein kinase family protein n=1 Tax=Herbiconiux sp. VKM Ac-2851 TaxID=2739025 RepID=UPI001565473A|nr:protein kinase family protein [Herbiconiux sp. VKM Ac-2851]NQX34717.1 protein kinase family protein [Herbiconiux sp. VKM Ac-2851]